MDVKQETSLDETRERVVQAVAEIAKGIKIVNFYPPRHPALTQAIWKIISAIEAVPPPETGIEIDVTKNTLLYREEPLPAGNKAIADLNRELYHRRASRIILLPNQKSEEMITFLGTLNRDFRDLQDEGGLEKVLLREKVSRIWVNRVDYEGLTEMLKKEEETPAVEDEEGFRSGDPSFDFEDRPAEEREIGELLQSLEKETDPAAYRDLVISVTRALLRERDDLTSIRHRGETRRSPTLPAWGSRSWSPTTWCPTTSVASSSREDTTARRWRRFSRPSASGP